MNKPPEMSFPLAITLRVIGRNQADLPAVLVALVSRFAAEVDAAGMIVRTSRDGNYLSVLLPIRLESREQFEAVYRELNAHEAVITVL